MSDRTCPECGTPLAGTWTNIGGHQTGSSNCKIAKMARDMSAIDYAHVSGEVAVGLRAFGVPIKYGKVANPDAGNMLAAGRAKQAVIGSFAPKAHAYIYLASPDGMRLGRAIERANNDPDFRAAIVVTADLSENQIAASRAVREFLAAEKLL